MKTTGLLALGVGLVLFLAVFGALRARPKSPVLRTQELSTGEIVKTADPAPREPAERAVIVRRERPVAGKTAAAATPAEPLPVMPTKLERLEQIREKFKGLAAGDPKAALAAAREIKDEGEREAALLTLVTAWRGGELHPPRQRAGAIASFGLEAGLGFELVKDPELAALWANELTEGENRTALLMSAANQMLNTNAIAAIAWAQQLSGEDRRKVLDSVLAGWAQNDTDEALDWAQHVSDAAERDSAIQAIRQAAPVGIGAQLQVQDGYPVITGLLLGTPIELSGQIHAGDRIVGIAQGDSVFMDTRSVPLQEVVQVIRGAPGTVIQLQVNSADSAPESAPRTISIVRAQIRFKR